MPLPPSSLSIICDHIRAFIRSGIETPDTPVEVFVGSPGALDQSDNHQLNLFFYRFEPSGFEAAAHPERPWRIRLFCMITPFANDTSDGENVTAGENDLRILGEVMRVLHESPILPDVSVGDEIVRPRAVFLSTTDEQINQIWSTQGDTHYRPSAIYEMSLAPIIPSELAPIPGRVAALGFEAVSDGNPYSPITGTVQGPPVHAQSVDIRNPAWTPLIAFVIGDDLHKSLVFDVESPEFAGFVPGIWLAGDPNETVDLIWQVWQPEGFTNTGAPLNASPVNDRIDPDAVPDQPGFPINFALPVTLDATATSLQLLLFAERSFAINGGPSQTVRSDPLMITLYRN